MAEVCAISTKTPWKPRNKSSVWSIAAPLFTNSPMDQQEFRSIRARNVEKKVEPKGMKIHNQCCEKILTSTLGAREIKLRLTNAITPRKYSFSKENTEPNKILVAESCYPGNLVMNLENCTKNR